MSQDIRSYFSVKTTDVKSVSNKSGTPVSKRSFILDSDSETELRVKKDKIPQKRYGNRKVKITTVLNSSDEDIPVKRRKTENHDTRGKRKNVILSEESSDENTSDNIAFVKTKSSEKGKRKKSESCRSSMKEKQLVKPSSSQNKLPVVITRSKYFKPANPEDVFGTEPVKRSKTEIRLEESEDMNDKEFEAALLQLDEADVNWAENTLSRNGIQEKQNEILSNANNNCEKGNRDSLNKLSPIDDVNVEIARKNVKTCSDPTNEIDVITKANLKNDEGYDSPIQKNRSKIHSPGYDSTASNQEKSSPGEFNSQQSFVDSQDSGVVIRKSVKNNNLKPENIDRKTTLANKLNTVKDVIRSAESKPANNMLWVDKYKPQSTSKLVGQQGERSNVNKLKNWLSNWYKNNAGRKKSYNIPNNWNSDPNGYNYKAALLSGPPGVGKTTSVVLVCKELAFDIVEFNASDTRSKNSLQQQISELLTSTSLNSSFNDTNRDNNMRINRKRVLIMDEVDGMAGNEDRGGIQELIALIKKSKVPIICICNDRSHPKIRSLVNYCFDLRYARPRLEQIKGYMMSICYKEHLNIPSDVLTDLIVNTNHDIRLTLNHLSMLAADKSSNDLYSDKKNVKIGPWDVVRMVFSSEEHKKMSIHDQCDLFFYDYNAAPLFVHENYLSVKPHHVDAKDNVKKMKLFALAADSIAVGEEIQTCIRKTNAWSLLPVQAIFSSYVPGTILEGHCSGQINFPSWFPQNSKQSKMARLTQEVQVHTRLKVSGSKRAILLDYIHHLRNSIITPLVRNGADGVKTSIDKLHDYDLLKEDLDSLNELCTWSQKDNLFSKLDSKLKATFTRMYNKEKPLCPYSLSAPVKKGKQSTGDDVDALLLEENENDTETIENGDEDNDIDAMIIEKKRPTKKLSKADNKAALTSSQDDGDNSSKSKGRKSTQGKKSKR